MSDNPTGADNQQESLSTVIAVLRILRGHTPDLQRTLENDMVRAARRRAEVSGTETTHPSLGT
jgi:hypothetical protein